MKKTSLTKEQKASIAALKARVENMMKNYAKASKFGLTDSELRQYFGDRIMRIFGNWIDGQTCALTDDGQCVVYPEDIDRFLGMLIYRTRTHWD